MAKYIDADEFVSLKREWYCDQCEKRKGMKRGRLQFVYEIGGPPCRACDVDDMISDIEEFPNADVEPKRRWIPVTERLPEEKINPNTHDFEYVQCATVFGDVRPFKFGTRIGETQPHFWNGAGYADAYITHWMPLTEPPKGEEDD